MDCRITKNFLREKNRLCDGACNLCVLSSHKNGVGMSCFAFCGKYPEEAIRLVQKWSGENPIEIDWTKVPANTPVWVKDEGEYRWKNKHFVAYLPARPISKFGVLTTGDFDFVAIENAIGISFYQECRLDDSVDPTPYLKES